MSTPKHNPEIDNLAYQYLKEKSNLARNDHGNYIAEIGDDLVNLKYLLSEFYQWTKNKNEFIND